MHSKQKRAVITTAQGYEDEEVIYPVIRLKEAGFHVDIATKGKVLTIGRKKYPLETLIKYYAELVEATTLNSDMYDVVIIPGGFEAPDRVRQIPEVLDFIKKMHARGKIVAAICHGPWVLISAGLLHGKKVTGHDGIKDDLHNAGADYSRQGVVIDGDIITSHCPRDLGVFMKAIVEAV